MDWFIVPLSEALKLHAVDTEIFRWFNLLGELGADVIEVLKFFVCQSPGVKHPQAYAAWPQNDVIVLVLSFYTFHFEPHSCNLAKLLKVRIGLAIGDDGNYRTRLGRVSTPLVRMDMWSGLIDLIYTLTYCFVSCFLFCQCVQHHESMA